MRLACGENRHLACFELAVEQAGRPLSVDSADYSITINDLKFRWEWDPIRSFRNSRMRTLKGHEAFRLTGKSLGRRYTEPTTTYNYVVVGLLKSFSFSK